MDSSSADAAQTKSFLKWCNFHLKSQGATIESFTDPNFTNSVLLAKLLCAISGENVFVKPAKMRIQKIESANKCIQFIKSKKVDIRHVSAENIVDGDIKLVLGLIWTIVLRFAVQDLGIEGMTAREGLLLWCNNRLKAYNLKVDDFGRSWADGKAYAAIVHSCDSSALNYEDISKKSNEERVKEAFTAAESTLGIDQLLDVEDVCTPTGPDEKANTAYCSLFCTRFSEQSNRERAARRVNKFVVANKVSRDLKNEYESRTKALLEQYRAIVAAWDALTFDGTFRDVDGKHKAHATFRNTTKRQLVSERSNLAALHGNIQSQQSIFGFAAYVAPKGMLVTDVADAAAKFFERSEAVRSLIRQKTREVRENIKLAYCDGAKSFMKSIDDITEKLAKITGKPDDQAKSVGAMQKELSTLALELPKLDKMWKDCIEAGVENSDEISNTFEDLKWDHEDLSSKLAGKMNVIENQRTQANNSKLSAEKLDHYDKTFRAFDKDGNNMLNSCEFENALKVLNIAITPEQAKSLFVRDSDSMEKEISYSDFIDYVSNVEEDRSTKTQVMEAFGIVCKTPTIDVQTLRNCGCDEALAKETIEFAPKGADTAVHFKELIDVAYN